MSAQKDRCLQEKTEGEEGGISFTGEVEEEEGKKEEEEGEEEKEEEEEGISFNCGERRNHFRNTNLLF